MAGFAPEIIAAAAAAAATEGAAGLPAAMASALGPAPSPKKRKSTPKIDIDVAIARHMEEVKAAAKLVHQARKQARNEKRKKQRLMKKAANLTPDDLERIAVLKRCGLWQPGAEALDGQALMGAGGGSASSSPVAEVPAEVLVPLPPPEAPATDGEGSSDEEPRKPEE